MWFKKLGYESNTPWKPYKSNVRFPTSFLTEFFSEIWMHPLVFLEKGKQSLFKPSLRANAAENVANTTVNVMSSPSYSSSSEVKGWKFGSAEISWNWLQLLCCAYLQSRPGYFEVQMEVTNRVPGMLRNGGSVLEPFQVRVRRQESQRFRVEEFGGMWNVQNAPGWN